MHTIADTRVTHFALGDVCLTPGARSALLRNRVNVISLLSRHARSDWGDVDEDDAQANCDAVLNFSRILSVYAIGGDDRVYVITEADRSLTTVLLPSEY